MDPRAPLVVLISELDHLEYSSPNCLEIVASEVPPLPRSERGNLQPLMRLSVAEPRRVVSVFWLLVSLASQHRSTVLAQ